jgi:hypothetical protein
MALGHISEAACFNPIDGKIARKLNELVDKVNDLQNQLDESRRLIRQANKTGEYM